MADFITPTAASKDAKVHHNTITAWLRTYPGLGRKVGGRWRVYPAALERVLSGVPLDQLDPR